MFWTNVLVLVLLSTFTTQDSCQNTSSWLIRQKRQAEVYHIEYHVPEPEFEDETTKKLKVFGEDFERFQIKHLPQHDGNSVDSYEDFTSSEDRARQILIDMHVVCPKGDILPTKNKIENAVKQVENRKITKVSANLLELRADLENVLAKYAKENLDATVDENGIINTFDHKDTLLKTLFLTNSEYICTELSFEKSTTEIVQETPDGPKKIIETKLDVVAKQYKSKVWLGLRYDGLPVHFEGLEGDWISDKKFLVNQPNPIKPIERTPLKGPTKIASFSENHLIVINQEVQKMRNQLKKSQKTEANAGQYELVYNPKFENFNSAHKKFTENLQKGKVIKNTYSHDSTYSCFSRARRKRSIASSCVIFFDSHGEVVDVNSKNYVDEYQKADDLKKHEMSKIIKENRHKLENLENDANTQNMWDLVNYEDLKTQAVKNGEVESVYKLPSDLPNHSDNIGSKIVYAVDDYYESIQNLEADVKLSPAKAATKLTALTSTKQYKKFAGGVSKVSSALGKTFMAKSIITGIIHGDDTSLAIIGGRVGYEVVTESAVKFGSTYFKQTSKVGVATKTLGGIAGPIGDVIDIGLSTYALAKSIGDLKNATNKYEKYDAIANIISNSIDIIITSTIAVLSITFPPLAPVFAAVGILLDFLNQIGMAIFGAANAVSAINAEIPLSKSEKNEAFVSRLFDIFGTRTKQYVDFLVAEKKANDMAVQNALKFLESNTEFLGVVFPSMTLSADGNCKLYIRHCRLKVAWGCAAGQWEPKYLLGEKCEYNRPCSKHRDICVNHWRRIGKHGYDQFYCECGNSHVEMNFDTPRRNSYVDFRQKQSIFLERAVPEDVKNGAFICKPGSKTYLTHKVSQDSRSAEYLCENAIGVLQPSNRRKIGQIMLFQLEDGNDTIYLSRNSDFPSLFIMGNEGYKHFEGGNKRNDFVFSSSCSSSLRGYISGGSNIDSISLGEFCGRNMPVTVDCQQGIMRSIGANLNVRFNSIEEIVGRKGQREIVTASCTTKQIVGFGGLQNQPDEIRVQENPNCKHDLTIVTSAYTKIISKAKHGNITIPVTGIPSDIEITLDAYPVQQLNNAIVFFNVSSSQTKLNVFQNYTQSIQLDLLCNSGKVKITSNFKSNSEQQISILFNEKPEGSPYSVLFATTSGEKLFYHSLPKLNGVLSRVGSSNIKNIFDIIGNHWTVTGGDLDDEFVLHTNKFAFIDGKGGIDTLKIHPDVNEPVTINLLSGNIRNVEKLIGSPGKPLTVHTACNTELVATGGGSGTTPDVVHVDYITCPYQKVNTQILASGATEVKVERNLTENNNINIFVDGTTNDTLQFGLETKTKFTENLLVNILLNDTNWQIKSTDCSKSQQAVILELQKVFTNETGNINFFLRSNLDDDNSNNLEIPYIQMSATGSIPGVMVMNQQTCLPKLFFNIDNFNNLAYLKGFVGIENVFKLTNSSTNVKIEGGSKNNLFIITPTPSDTYLYELSGGENGTNTLVVENDDSSEILVHSSSTTDVLSPFLIDIHSNKMGFLNSNISLLGNVANIHHVIGRQNAPDHIHASCKTKSIDGRGGFSSKYADIVHISDIQSLCLMNLIVTVDKFTNVKNTMSVGNFVYFVNDLVTSSFEITPTTENTHHIHLNLYPWKFITSVTFDRETNKLNWMVLNGNESKTQSFQLVKPNSAEQYSNPVFQFGPPDTSVSSEISVENDGTTVATFVIRENMYSEEIHGLPVDLNKFLINVTSVSSSSNGVIHGCANNCYSNQFFILNLESSIEILDGGKCISKGCVNLLYISKTWTLEELEVNLDIASGYLKDSKGNHRISKLQNFNEFHGTENTTVFASCDTKQISGVGKVLIRQQNCSVDLILGVENYTEIWFLEQNGTIMEWNATTDENIVNYRFSSPMSFDPQGNFSLIQNYTHNYYWPFTLSNLSEIWFDEYEQSLFYTINQIQYNHKMITFPDIVDQFYPQPNIITADNFRIQIARDHSIWATWGEDYPKYTPNDRIELELLANKLGVTIIIQTPSDFVFIGHSISYNAEDRNVLQNTENTTSHLSGGGSEETIYEIVDLGNDVYIYTGFVHQNYTNGSYSRSLRRQTIGLTDIVNPIRKNTDSKYVPKVRPNGDALVIAMSGYENIFPGKIIIANGTKPWVSSKLQLLVGTSYMHLAEDHGVHITPSNTSRSKRSVDVEWSIRPRPILIPDSIRIYSIAPEDLEDEQEIRLEASKSGKISVTQSSETFEAARKGNDLHLTNLVNMGDLGSKSVLITGFYETMPEFSTNDASNVVNSTGSNLIRGVKIALPGLLVLINETTLWKINNDKIMLNETERVVALEIVYERAESKLLQNFPKLPRQFQGSTSNIGTVIIVLGCAFLMHLVVVATSYTLCTLRNRGELPLLKILKRYKENKEVQNYLHQ